jgi:hypothetical protein
MPATAELFPEPDRPEVAPMYADTSGGTGRITYTRHRPRTTQRCDDCMAAYVLADREGRDRSSVPTARTAAFRRKQQGCNPLLLCHPHKAMREAEEAGR